MTHLPSTPTPGRHDVEEAALELIHSVMADDWSSDVAGSRLWTRSRGNRHVLLLLRARVARHLAGRPTPIDERAAATLDAALRSTDTPAGTPGDGPHRHGPHRHELLVPQQSAG